MKKYSSWILVIEAISINEIIKIQFLYPYAWLSALKFDNTSEDSAISMHWQRKYIEKPFIISAALLEVFVSVLLTSYRHTMLKLRHEFNV